MQSSFMKIVVHIMNNEIGCFNRFVSREQVRHSTVAIIAYRQVPGWGEAGGSALLLNAVMWHSTHELVHTSQTP